VNSAVVCIKDVVSFPELAVSCVLIGHLNSNEYLTVDSATLLHFPSSDGETYSDGVEAHLCLAAGILSPQPCVSIDEHHSSLCTVTAETIILRLATLFRQLLLARLHMQPATCHSSMYHISLFFTILLTVLAEYNMDRVFAATLKNI